MPFAVRGSVPAVALLASTGAFTGFTGCAHPGASEDLGKVDTPIIGGSLDTSHRGVVSLLKRVQGGYFPSCSGTLLTQNLVLTAHHCVAPLDSEDGSSVECGVTRFRAPNRADSMLISIEANVGEEGINPFRVAEVWLPPNAGSDVCGKDIALLLLSGAGVPGSAATPIQPRLSDEVDPNEVFAAIGYGLQDPEDDDGSTAGQRMSVTDAKVFCAGAACGTELVSTNEWIADSPVCSGDSGGPALDGNGQVAGVTSRGDQECTVGIYSSVYAWSDFIKAGVFEAAEAGRYNPPAWAGEPPPGFDPGTVDPVGGTSAIGSGGRAPVAGASTSGGNSSGGGGAGSSSGGANSSAGNGPGSPTIDPLGLTCSGRCPGAYLCWSGTGQPPGICVPACGANRAECPADYTCSSELGACVPGSKPASGGASSDDGSCSVAAPVTGSAGRSVWACLAALGLALTRRRVSRAARIGT